MVSIISMNVNKTKLSATKGFTIVHYRPWFTGATLIKIGVCKFPFIRRISLETKMSPLIAQMLAFLGTLFILTMASDFSFQSFNAGKL